MSARAGASDLASGTPDWVVRLGRQRANGTLTPHSTGTVEHHRRRIGNASTSYAPAS